MISVPVLVFAETANSSKQIKGSKMNWLFDQKKNVAAVTTAQVIHENYPILSVVHYSDDHSWAFLCGTTNKSEDLKLISMEQAVNIDSTIMSIADLPPGWSAYRDSVSSKWIRQKDDDL